MGGRGQNYRVARTIVGRYGLEDITASKNEIVDYFRRAGAEGGIRLVGEGRNRQIRVSRAARDMAEETARSLSERIVDRNPEAERDYNDIPDFGAYARSSENFVRIGNRNATQSVDQLYEELAGSYAGRRCCHIRTGTALQG